MAKGFTVRAAAPEAKPLEDEFNLQAAKELIKGKTIVFCLPGRGVSYVYLKNFVQLCFDLVQSGAAIQISQVSSIQPCVSTARIHAASSCIAIQQTCTILTTTWPPAGARPTAP